MAKASAKKAAAARREARQVFLPLIVAINLFYYLLKFLRGGRWLPSVMGEGIAGAFFAAVYAVVYTQILHHAETHTTATTPTSSAALVGGPWLDALAVLAVIQFSTAFFTAAYWLLAVLPLWAAWALYQAVLGKQGLMGGFTGGGGGAPSATQNSDPATLQNRKQRRAEQRKQR